MNPVKVTLTVDRRLLVLVVVIAIFGAFQLYGSFGGLKIKPVADTVESSNRWPEAGGRLVIKAWDWWGLKRAEFLVEMRDIALEDNCEKRWMIIDSTGLKSGWTVLPRPLFFDNHDPNSPGTAFNIWSREAQWFNFRSIETSNHAKE